MSPITYKAYVAQAKMKVIRPEVAEINEKFKNDPMKKQQETMKLYSKAGVNPMAGCIPGLLQIPIFYALFQFFPSAFDLRQKSFLWADDLSSYDNVLNLPFYIPFMRKPRLSGGVDSSVAAYLLKEQGYEVIGLFMKNWHDDSVTISNECPWLEDSNDALMVADKLGIPFQTVDLSEQYKERIVDYMFNEYENGRTPNPDVLCNREIKFDVFNENCCKSLGRLCWQQDIIAVRNGNSGNTANPTIGVPSDATTALAIGSVDNTEQRSSFSSIGPTSDGRIKPDLMAMGTATIVANQTGTISPAPEAGVDAVVAEGFEAGGHNGREESTTLTLIPMVKQQISIPLIAAGGIATGRGMHAAMILGADAVQMGTRFAMTTESSSHNNFKQMLTELGEGDTHLTLKGGASFVDK
ncbi:hypothetical protein FQR65_LT19631 [Abscondita terminalis]|nr:hypothetical protein FQR65_LT19631 [Abscondita terminalis]